MISRIEMVRPSSNSTSKRAEDQLAARFLFDRITTSRDKSERAGEIDHILLEGHAFCDDDTRCNLACENAKSQRLKMRHGFSTPEIMRLQKNFEKSACILLGS
jgi:hypothetical protein